MGCVLCCAPCWLRVFGIVCTLALSKAQGVLLHSVRRQRERCVRDRLSKRHLLSKVRGLRTRRLCLACAPVSRFDGLVAFLTHICRLPVSGVWWTLLTSLLFAGFRDRLHGSSV